MIFLAPTTTATAMVALIWHFRFRSWEGEIDEGDEDEQIARDRPDLVTVHATRFLHRIPGQEAK